MLNSDAETARIRYLYRKMILDGEIKLPLDMVIKLVGPDTAYHLYGDNEYSSSSQDKNQEKDDELETKNEDDENDQNVETNPAENTGESDKNNSVEK